MELIEDRRMEDRRMEGRRMEDVSVTSSPPELYKKYLSCLCAVTISCIVITSTLLIHILRYPEEPSYEQLLKLVREVKESEVAECYNPLYPANKTKRKPLLLRQVKLGERECC